MSSKQIGDGEHFGGQMSFLDHLDELRKRLVRSVIFIIVAFVFCWFVSQPIYNFLSVPVRQALSEAERRQLPLQGETGDEKILPLSDLKKGDKGRFTFNQATKLGNSVLQPGTSVLARVETTREGINVLYTDEAIYTSNGVIPKGVLLPIDLSPDAVNEQSPDERMIVTTATGPFTLYVTVSLYAALALSVPFLLLQIWGFISPALYKHERAYVTPFILLSTTSFVAGAAFAYYILFPPAVSYLLGLGEDFKLLLNASDYFDLITLIMLAMGVIFQMPAVAYVLARIGIISAGLMLRSWKIALVVILIVAAVVSPTGDIPNLMLFAAPMIVLYIVSIFIAWFFGKKRQTDAEVTA